LRSPKNWTIIPPSSPYSSSDVTQPSTVGLLTTQLDATASVFRCRLKVSSSTLNHGPVRSSFFTAPVWICTMPRLATKHMIDRPVAAVFQHGLHGALVHLLRQIRADRAQRAQPRYLELAKHRKEVVRVLERAPVRAQGPSSAGASASSIRSKPSTRTGAISCAAWRSM
jgi:hypothetical protein